MGNFGHCRPKPKAPGEQDRCQLRLTTGHNLFGSMHLHWLRGPLTCPAHSAAMPEWMATTCPIHWTL
ncbi:hypothetical protein TNCV_66291 [Trichonephila clavipes]|nr:hypothetical protein TNCV_66291 [Trichonephila clavipes]